MSKYKAVLFMCNDEPRAEFVIENFTKHNPDIPLVVYNGGRSALYLKDKYKISLIEGKNLWHKTTRNPPGSFSYEWFEYLFFMGENMEQDYLIFLETDVKVNRPIQGEPQYDISGPTTFCGPLDQVVAYDFWGGYLKGTMDDQTDWGPKIHTSMGGTVFKKSFFKACKENLKYVKMAYDLIPLNCYQDLMMTLLARFSGCTYGDWSEASDTRGVFRLINNQWYHEPCNENCALIHNYKV
jgi:hypothetical protein